MKLKSTYYTLITLFLLSLSSCLSDPDLPSEMINAKVPDIKTLQVDGQTATTITLTAEVQKENGSSVTDYGVYWSKTTPIDINTAESISAGQGKGKFTVTIEGLTNNTTYYIAPYAKNNKGIGLGETEKVVTSLGLGTVTTLNPQNLKAVSADLGGLIIGRGEGEIKRRGVYLSKKPNAAQPDTILVSEMATDSFICHAINLNPNMTYYVTAFVENSFGIFSGEEKAFTTTTGLPVLNGITKVDIGFYDAIFKSEVKSEGDAPVTKRGFCYSIEDGELPTIKNDTVLCGEGIGTFEGKLTNLTNQNRYIVRAFAVNSFGVVYSTDTIFRVKSDYPTVQMNPEVELALGSAKVMAEVLDKGHSDIIEYGFCWSDTNSLPDSTDNHIAINPSQPFTVSINKLVGNKTYYIRAYAKNSIKLAYSAPISFKTPAIFTSMTPLNQDIIQGSASFFFTKDAGFILGGKKSSVYTNELWRYNLAQGNWVQRTDYPESLVINGQTSVVIGNSVYIFGGQNEVGLTITYTNSFYKYDIYNDRWSKLEIAGTPGPVSFAAGCNLGQSAYYFGGIRNNTIINEVSKYNIQDDVWTIKNNLPRAQYGGVALVVNNKIYVGLGMTDLQGTTNNKLLWSSSITDETWVECKAIPNDASKIIGGVVFNDEIYVVDNTGQIWKYSPRENEWYKKYHLSVLGNQIHCVYLLDNKMYIGLGNGANTFVAYNPYWDN